MHLCIILFMCIIFNTHTVRIWHTYVHVRMYLCLYTGSYAFMHIYACMYLYMSIRTYNYNVCMYYVRTYVCLYIL